MQHLKMIGPLAETISPWSLTTDLISSGTYMPVLAGTTTSLYSLQPLV